MTSFVEGTTLTRIIDCVRTWSALNFESSSEPSSSTVKAPGTELGDGEGEREVKIEVGDGLGSWITWPVASSAVCAAGTKYAKPPATDDIAMASRMRKLVRSGLSRRRDALTRCPGRKPRGTGLHSNL